MSKAPSRGSDACAEIALWMPEQFSALIAISIKPFLWNASELREHDVQREAAMPFGKDALVRTHHDPVVQYPDDLKNR